MRPWSSSAIGAVEVEQGLVGMAAQGLVEERDRFGAALALAEQRAEVEVGVGVVGVEREHLSVGRFRAALVAGLERLAAAEHRGRVVAQRCRVWTRTLAQVRHRRRQRRRDRARRALQERDRAFRRRELEVHHQLADSACHCARPSRTVTSLPSAVMRRPVSGSSAGSRARSFLSEARILRGEMRARLQLDGGAQQHDVLERESVFVALAALRGDEA